MNSNCKCLHCLFAVIAFTALTIPICAQAPPLFFLHSSKTSYEPLDTITISSQVAGNIEVADHAGNVYFSSSIKSQLSFATGGALGIQQIRLMSSSGKLLSSQPIRVDARTSIDDGGDMHWLFNALYQGLMSKNDGAGYGEILYRGKQYRAFELWDLDNNNIMNGMQYFLPYGNELTDLLRQTQREDGMIWSFVESAGTGSGRSYYYQTAYDSIDCFRRDGDFFMVRQPVDNHSDYNFVNMLFKHWQASGNTGWMQQNIDAAIRALDYCYTDSLRWSSRYGLLKRPLTIDSWDFQVADEYTAPAVVSPTMVIVPGKTRFGIFFGDNTGYFEACNQLAEMLDSTGQASRAATWRARAEKILANLMRVSWNGDFFTHFVDEDSMVVRKLGVDMKQQIAQGNMYSLNRGLPAAVNRKIIQTYQSLQKRLPPGSPGEWYAIYPPFGRGFESHNAKWEYMNGGVAGHAIGELARGAYENGSEEYASDIMTRMLGLVRKYDNRLHFSYRGAIEPAPKANYRTIDLGAYANMDLRDKGDINSFRWFNLDWPGNDLRNMPVGRQVFEGIPYLVSDPETNKRSSAVAVGISGSLPLKVRVLVNDTASCVYLLHALNGAPPTVAGLITFVYADSSRFSKYVVSGTELKNWWFTEIDHERAGVAWWGPNPVSAKVAVCWLAIDNPFPAKKLSAIEIGASHEGGVYAVLGITISSKPFFIKHEGVSYGGPEYNWSSANALAAMVEGLAGVVNTGLKFNSVRLSPRWVSMATDTVTTIIRFAASDGYVAYRFMHDSTHHSIRLITTGSGRDAVVHLLLPAGTRSVKSVTSGKDHVAFVNSRIEQSGYVDFKLPLNQVSQVLVKYE